MEAGFSLSTAGSPGPPHVVSTSMALCSPCWSLVQLVCASCFRVRFGGYSPADWVGSWKYWGEPRYVDKADTAPPPHRSGGFPGPAVPVPEAPLHPQAPMRFARSHAFPLSRGPCRTGRWDPREQHCPGQHRERGPVGGPQHEGGCRPARAPGQVPPEGRGQASCCVQLRQGPGQDLVTPGEALSRGLLGSGVAGSGDRQPGGGSSWDLGTAGRSRGSPACGFAWCLVIL